VIGDVFQCVFHAKVVDNFAVKDWGEMSKLTDGRLIFITIMKVIPKGTTRNSSVSWKLKL